MSAHHEHASAQVEYMHLCDYAFVSDHGKPGIIGIFDHIWADRFPTNHMLLCIAIQLRGQQGHKVPIRVVLETPDGEKILESPENLVTFNAGGGAFININLLNLPLKTSGRYSVSVISQGSVLASQTLRVVKREQRTATA